MSNQFLKEHAVYQIYPISFKDSNGDGKGDLPGITSKLDYLKEIGIKIIWLSPIYCSPMFDMGYDISDYYNINPIFGTMDDFDNLMKETKARGMKVIMDLVVNHTSDEHPWFKDALKNPDSPYRNYYIFKKGKKDKKGRDLPPNNWESNFTGSAWEKVEGEDNMYYLHLFHKKQPDLNWDNPKVLEEVENIISFWMDKGVYGFRCDVISEIYKESFEDGSKSRTGVAPIGSEHYVATDGNHRILKQIRKDVIDKKGGVLIGECGGGITPEDGVKYLDNELDTFFQFDTAAVYKNLLSTEASMKKFRKEIIRWQSIVDYNGNYLENHDQHRAIGKYVKGKFADIGDKMLLTMLFTLRGTPFIYMGEEVGARDYDKPLPIEECTDCVTQYIYNLAIKKYHLPKKLAAHLARKMGRDDCRAPMAFTSEPNQGFSESDKPWQRYNPTNKNYNYEAEKNDENSILSYFKKLNELRENNKAFIYGEIKFLDTSKNLLNYIRRDGDDIFMVLLNLTNKKVSYPLGFDTVKKEKVLSNYNEESNRLRPYEAAVYRLSKKN